MVRSEVELWKLFSLQLEDDLLRNSERMAATEEIIPYIQSPIVSQYLFNQGFRPKYPNGAEMACIFSADLDNVFYSMPLMQKGKWLASNLLKLQWNLLITQGKKVLFNEVHPNKTLEKIYTWTQQRSIPCTYFILSLNPDEEDFNYEVEKIKSHIEEFCGADFELGLHGSHEAYNSSSKMLEEKTKLEGAMQRPIRSYRNHYLKFTKYSTWRAQQDCGIEIDCTLSFHNFPGFRNGLCYPSFTYFSDKREWSNFVHLPLNCMDIQFYKYLSLSKESAIDFFRIQWNEVKKANGVFSLLWHNDRFHGEYGELIDAVYDSVMQKDNVWYTTPSELLKHYKSEGYLDELKFMLNKISTCI